MSEAPHSIPGDRMIRAQKSARQMAGAFYIDLRLFA